MPPALDGSHLSKRSQSLSSYLHFLGWRVNVLTDQNLPRVVIVRFVRSIVRISPIAVCLFFRWAGLALVYKKWWRLFELFDSWRTDPQQVLWEQSDSHRGSAREFGANYGSVYRPLLDFVDDNDDWDFPSAIEGTSRNELLSDGNYKTWKLRVGQWIQKFCRTS